MTAVHTADRKRWGTANDHGITWNDGQIVVFDSVDQIGDATISEVRCPLCDVFGPYWGVCGAHIVTVPLEIRATLRAGLIEEGHDQIRAWSEVKMKIKKSATEGLCGAMRCDAPVKYKLDGKPWGLDRADVCERHYGTALSAFPGQIKVIELDVEVSIEADAPIANVEPNPGPGYRTDVESAITEQSGSDLAKACDTELSSENAYVSECGDFLKGYEITTQAEVVSLAELLREIKGKRNRLDERRQQITKPMNESLRSVNAFFNKPIHALDALEGDIKRLIGNFKLKEEQERRRALAAAEAAHVAGDTVAMSEALSKVTHVASVPGLSTSRAWEFVIEDVTLIPREYMVPNQLLLTQASKNEELRTRGVPGVRFFETTPTVRSRAT